MPAAVARRTTSLFLLFHVAISLVGILPGSVVVLVANRTLCRWTAAFLAMTVLTSATALYLNVFVLIVQLFLKVPELLALAPKGSEPP
jgi:threonine/homoserine/homoserine lactone efflux protein